MSLADHTGQQHGVSSGAHTALGQLEPLTGQAGDSRGAFLCSPPEGAGQAEPHLPTGSVQWP